MTLWVGPKVRSPGPDLRSWYLWFSALAAVCHWSMVSGIVFLIRHALYKGVMSPLLKNSTVPGASLDHPASPARRSNWRMYSSSCLGAIFKVTSCPYAFSLFKESVQSLSKVARKSSHNFLLFLVTVFVVSAIAASIASSMELTHSITDGPLNRVKQYRIRE